MCNYRMNVSSVINMLNHTVSEQLELNYLRVFDSLLAGSLMTLLCDSVAKKKNKQKNRIRKIKIESKKAQLQIHNIIPAELSGSNTAVVLTIETPDAAFCPDPLTNCHWEESDGLLSQRGKDRVNKEKQQAHINTMKTNKAVTEQLLLFSPVRVPQSCQRSSRWQGRTSLMACRQQYGHLYLREMSFNTYDR